MMVSRLQPLVSNQAVVNADGTPTQYFIRWAQERQIDISEGITEAQARQLITDFAANRQIIAGTALTGGGKLSSDVTLALSDTMVVPGGYGDATHVPRLVVDQQGRVQAATQVPVQAGVPEAPNDGSFYARRNLSWEAFTPGGGGGGIPEAPIDGRRYERRDAAWIETLPPGISDAPMDGMTYGRRNGAWAPQQAGGSSGILPVVDGSIPPVFIQADDGSLIYTEVT